MSRRPVGLVAVLALLWLHVGVARGSRFTGFTSAVPLGTDSGALEGDAAGDRFGTSVANAGDVNGDGYPDLIVGAPGVLAPSGGMGSARVVSGRDGAILYVFQAAAEERAFGSSVAGAGDVNADGFADLIVGDPEGIGPYDEANEVSRLGVAHVYSGLDGSELHLLAGTGFFTFGASVAGAGDVNQDGYDDVLVGEYNGGPAGAGKAWVFSGATGSVLMELVGADDNDHFGYSVAGAGDVDGDGSPDVVVGALLGLHDGLSTGLARVHSGADGSLIHTFWGQAEGDMFGAAVDGAGDVDGDGYADVVVGAPRFDSGGDGRVQVFSGLDGSVLHTFVDEEPGGQFGTCVAGAGDVDSDGRDDLIVGAPRRHPGGHARVLSGRDGSVLFTFDSDVSGELLGLSVAGAGDITADGYADVIVGIPGAEAHGLDSGRVELYAGASSADSTPPVLVCPGPQTVEATGPFGAVVAFSATATDDETSDPLISYSVPPGSTFPLGVSGIVVTALDGAGNSASCVFIVTVVDTTAPALTVPANLVVDATSAAGAMVTFAATATDAVTPLPTILYSRAPGSTFPVGTRTVTVTAIDGAGNASSGTFTVRVRATAASLLDEALVSLRVPLEASSPKVDALVQAAIAELEKAATAASGAAYYKAVGQALHDLEKAASKLQKQAPSGSAEAVLTAAMEKAAGAAQAYALKSAPSNPSPLDEAKLSRLGTDVADALAAGEYEKAVKASEKLWEKSAPNGR